MLHMDHGISRVQQTLSLDLEIMFVSRVMNVMDVIAITKHHKKITASDLAEARQTSLELNMVQLCRASLGTFKLGAINKSQI